MCRKISLPKQRPKTIEMRQFKNFDSVAFHNDLREAFTTCNVHSDPNIMWEEWKTTFLKIANFHAPIRTRKVKSTHTPWITEDIKKLGYRRDYLKKKAVRLKSNNYHIAYKLCRNQVTKLIRNEKTKYYNTKLKNCSNSKECWQAINKLLNKQSKSTMINNIKVKGSDVTGDKNVAEEFNNYFCSIEPELANNIYSPGIDPLSYVTPVSSTFECYDITYKELICVIQNLKISKSPSLDKISVKFLKEAGNSIILTIAHLFNLSLRTGIFLDDWKFVKVTPIYKSGEKSDRGNYRPISVISVIAKVFEKLVYRQMMVYLDVNNIISANQSGFRSRLSTETTFLNGTSQWLVNMDFRLINGVLFLDLKKAFDTVDHNILLSKIQLYGIRGTAHKWFQSYLKDRKQICKINQTMSNAKSIHCGVPQETNLGSILFLLYINDLPNCLTKTISAMFADDTSLSCEGSSMI